MIKFLTVVALFQIGLILPSKAQKTSGLQTADSLFEQKKYTQSFEIYEKIFEEDQKQSPAMLLKMAYIKEGLGDLSEALYYLNKYYQLTLDKEALKKMEDLAQKHKLLGYANSDTDIFLNYYYQYLPYLLFVAMALALLFIALLYRQRKRSNIKPVFSGVALVLLLGLIFYMVNFTEENEKGIIMVPASYLMGGPSAGADVVEVVKPGHRVQVLGKEDIWVKIRWNGTVAFVKENNVRLL